MRQALALVRGRRSAAVLLAVAGTTALFTYFAIRDLNVGDVVDSLSGRSYWPLGPSLIVLAAAIAVRGVRWWMLFSSGSRPRFGPVMSALLIGYFFNNIFPARAGEVARVVALHQRARTSRVEAGATVVLERAYDVVALLLLLLLMLPTIPDVPWLRSAVFFGLGVAVVMAVTTGLLVGSGDRGRRLLVEALGRIPAVSPTEAREAVERLASGLLGLRRVRVALIALVLSVGSWAALGLSAWLVLEVFDFGLSPVAGIFVMIAIGFAMILPSGPAGIGVFEGAVVLALGVYGIAGAEALSCALVLHAVNFLPFIVAGGVVVVGHGRAIRRDRVTGAAAPGGDPPGANHRRRIGRSDAPDPEAV